MASVTQIIKDVKQPYGGFINSNEFNKVQFSDNEILAEENIHSSLIGLTVDYMTRFMLGDLLSEAFKISLHGADIIKESKVASDLLENIKGLDDKSIYSACKLVGYDVCYRVGPKAYKNIDTIEADSATINNIRIMVNRSINFFDKYGPVIKSGFTFSGGYTTKINTGDGDYLTSDTIWDFKVSSSSLNSKQTLQLLIYYIMGMHSTDNEFKNISKLGIFNPRLNCAYIKEISQISQQTIEYMSKEIIGYKTEEKDLNIVDVMKELKCTRYMVMKYYAEDDLPLYKLNNKYYISKKDLQEWVILKEEKESEKREITIFLSTLFLVIFLIILFIFIFIKYF